MFMAFKEFCKEPNVQKITIQEDQELTICGDTHGRFRDVMGIFDNNGPPSKNHIYVRKNDLFFVKI
jgi:serine/threonine-protein phosphatase 5